MLMVCMRKVTALLSVFVLLMALMPTSEVRADANACGAGFSFSSMPPDSQTSTYLQVNNNGSNAINWIKVVRPSDNFVLLGANGGVWTPSSNDTDVTFSGSTIDGGSVYNQLLIQIQSGSNQIPSETWTVQASENADGSSPVNCTNNGLDVNIDTGIAPNISNISTSVYSTTATISWATDKASTAQINYGTSSGYGSTTALDSSLKFTHSVTIDVLSAGTGYHFQISCTDSIGNNTISADNTFITSVALPNNTPIRVGSFAAPPNPTIPLKAVPSENIPPTIKLTTDVSGPQKTAPIIKGEAEDNEALAGIYYSINGGIDWLPVDIATGLGGKNSSFSFTLANPRDGNYSLIAKAVDTSKNVGITPTQTLIIDQLPPTIGGSIISIGSQQLTPGQDNIISTMVGIDQKISLNAVGGATNITLITTSPGKDKQLQSFSLSQSQDSGLWSGIINYSKPGLYQLTANALDGAGNTTSRKLYNVAVSPSGKVTGIKNQALKAMVTAYVLDSETNTWQLWDGEAYDQKNPSNITSVKGEYGLYLPAGTYYLRISASGYQTKITNSFTTNKAEIINGNFRLKNKLGIVLGPVRIQLPWISMSNTTSVVTSNTVFNAPKSTLIGTELPQFNILNTAGKYTRTADLYGKPTIMSFISTWGDLANDQLVTLESLGEPPINILAINPGEGVAKLKAYSQIAGYSTKLLADTDNKLFGALGGSNVPTTYFVDRHGVIKKVMYGVLSKQELLKNVAL
jgi:peroxiredoxin